MERDRTFSLLFAVALAAAGCGDDAPRGDGGKGGIDGSGATGGSGGAGAEGAPGTPALDPLDRMPRYAVVSTDFSSTSIAMLDENFEPIDQSWVNSGTTYPGLVATLSGDVVLPTRQAGDGTFAIIDRLFTDVVTQFYVPSGNLNGQVRTHGNVGETGYSSNPQDLVFADADSAWAVRYEPNLDDSAPPENQGTDLIEIDPKAMSTTGARIDLSAFNTTATVVGESGPVEVDVFARPSRAVLVGSKVIVGLERISAGFDAAGTGMVAVVDLDEQSASGLDVPGLENCGRVVPVPGADNKVLVACIGFSFPYGDEAQVRASAGLAVLDVSENGVTLERVWRVAEDSGSAIAVNAGVPVDAERVLGVANPNFVTSFVDTLYLTDITTGEQVPVREAADAFVIGTSAYDPDSGMLYVPDSNANAVIEYAAGEDGFMEIGSTTIAPGLGLPPTAVYSLD